MPFETVLITGGAGNLARQLTGDWLQEGHRIVLVDLPPAPPQLPADVEYHVADITEPGRLHTIFEQTRPQLVIHFASLLSGRSEQDRLLAWQVNVDAAFALFEAAVATGVESVFFPSSVAAYGHPLPQPVELDHPQWPTGLYGVTKACVERLGVYYHHHCDLDFRCLRLPVVVSQFAPPGAASAYASRCFVEAATQDRFTFRVRPETQPALIYVKDVLRAIRQVIQAPAARLSRQVYNLQALSPTAGDLCRAIGQRLPSADLVFEPDAEVVQLIESWPVRFDDSLARTDWDWTPRFDLAAMADDFLGELTNDAEDGTRLRGVG
ncbi:MAG: NAD-dependent epimerase/dehydratase family protein [Planctomycetaceae bacterium]|jgi:threonine 3-dehydrogenase|nr:NAD-dependent epimerase/dehydratase family protein [Planctomycetaceae bacterium]